MENGAHSKRSTASEAPRLRALNNLTSTAISSSEFAETNYRPPFGGGIGVERWAGGSGIARNISGGDFQSNGIAGSGSTQGVKRLCPSAFRISKMIPGRAIWTQFFHCAIATHSAVMRTPQWRRPEFHLFQFNEPIKSTARPNRNKIRKYGMRVPTTLDRQQLNRKFRQLSPDFAVPRYPETHFSRGHRGKLLKLRKKLG